VYARCPWHPSRAVDQEWLFLDSEHPELVPECPSFWNVALGCSFLQNIQSFWKVAWHRVIGKMKRKKWKKVRELDRKDGSHCKVMAFHQKQGFEKSRILELLCLLQSACVVASRAFSLESGFGPSFAQCDVDGCCGGVVFRASSSFVAMGGGEMKMVELLHCLPFPLLLELWKVGEKTYQASNSKTKQKQQSSSEVQQGQSQKKGNYW